jgi:hypothetical protein
MVQLAPLPILTSFHCWVKWEDEIGRGKMDSFQKLVSDELKSSLLGIPPSEGQHLSSQQIRHRLSHHGVIAIRFRSSISRMYFRETTNNPKTRRSSWISVGGTRKRFRARCDPAYLFTLNTKNCASLKSNLVLGSPKVMLYLRHTRRKTIKSANKSSMLLA